ncbi:hypothetical protein BY996DRAFT_6411639 [Phakopsora pachyrhizi]|nr:hypothetical protein BY996DRAFT_6411639 [Phakopsora pachyrhizi]
MVDVKVTEYLGNIDAPALTEATWLSRTSKMTVTQWKGLAWGINPFKETSLQKYEPLFRGEQVFGTIIPNLPDDRSCFNGPLLGEQTLNLLGRASAEAYPTPSSSPIGYQSSRNDIYSTLPFDYSLSCRDLATLFQHGESSTPDDQRSEEPQSSIFCDPWIPSTPPLCSSNPSWIEEIYPSLQTPSSASLGVILEPEVIDFTAQDFEKLLESFDPVSETTIEWKPECKTPLPISITKLKETPKNNLESGNLRKPIDLPPSPDSPLKSYAKRQRKRLASKACGDCKVDEMTDAREVREDGGEDCLLSKKALRNKSKRSNCTREKNPYILEAAAESTCSTNTTATESKVPSTVVIAGSGRDTPNPLKGSPINVSSSKTVDFAQLQSKFLIPQDPSSTLGQSSTIQSFQLSKPSTIFPASKAPLLFDDSSFNSRTKASDESLNNFLTSWPTTLESDSNKLITSIEGVNPMEDISGNLAMDIFPSLLPALPLTHPKTQIHTESSRMLLNGLKQLSLQGLGFDDFLSKHDDTVRDLFSKDKATLNESNGLNLNDLESRNFFLSDNQTFGCMNPSSILNSNSDDQSPSNYHRFIPNDSINLISPKTNSNLFESSCNDNSTTTFYSQEQENSLKFNNNSLGLNLFSSPSNHTRITTDFNRTPSSSSSKGSLKIKGSGSPSSPFSKKRKSSNLEIIHNSELSKVNNVRDQNDLTQTSTSLSKNKRFKSMNEICSSNSIFVNFTAKDSKMLLGGVAPTGRSKQNKNNT